MKLVALHLTDYKLPLVDVLSKYDTQGTKYMYRSDFIGSFLDNYLKLQLNPRTGEGLSLNQKQLLCTRYAQNPSVIQFPYEQFVSDLKRKEEEGKGTVRVYMTQKEVEEEDSFFVQADEHKQEVEFVNSNQQRIMTEELPPHSKRNTNVTQATLTKPQLKNISLASFVLDDMMMHTYRRGISVEAYFRAFSKVQGTELALTKEDFGRAIASLGIEWGSNMTRVAEIFDSIDVVGHDSQYLKRISPLDIAQTVLLNAGHNVEDILATHIMAVHKALKLRNMLGKLRELFNFINSKRDNSCTGLEFKQMIMDRLELGKQGIVKEP